ncbi:enoyl-CoA hydratase/isomerase family protein [Halobacteriales archaeon Cl-PHB]
MSDLVTYDRHDDRAVVTLTAPEQRNALSRDVATALHEAVDRATEDEVRCLAVQGSGGTFCAGGDVQGMLEAVATDITPEERFERVGEAVTESVRAVYECPVPTVTKVDGPAFGAGATLAIAGDVTIASDRSKIGFGFRQVGLSVDSTTSYILPRTVGESVALDLVLTGELVDADEAESLGLFSRVVPSEEFEQRSRALVERIATGPTLALRESKDLLQAGLDRSLDEAMAAEEEAMKRSLGTADHEEGARAFAEQRDPEFSGE